MLTFSSKVVELSCDDGNGNQPKILNIHPQGSISTPCRRRKLQDLGVLFGGIMPDIVCPICGKSFHLKPSRVKTRRTCGMDCRNVLYQKERKGPLNWRWKGGRYQSEGRWFVKAEGHPAANLYGYIEESRLLMEGELGRYLLPEEHIHHKNLDHTDNRIENLQILSNPEHARLHMKLRWTPEKRKEQSEAMTGRKLPEQWALNIKLGWARRRALRGSL